MHRQDAILTTAKQSSQEKKRTRRLLSHPISDIAYVAKEAGRLCVVERRERIDRYILDRACDELEKEKENKQARRRIGF